MQPYPTKCPEIRNWNAATATSFFVETMDTPAEADFIVIPAFGRSPTMGSFTVATDTHKPLSARTKVSFGCPANGSDPMLQAVAQARGYGVVIANSSLPRYVSLPKASATILLYDGNAEHRESVKLSLEGRGHRVAAYDSRLVESFSELRQKVNSADLVIFDLTVLDHDIVWSKLSLICGLRGPNGLPPRVGCSSRIDHGAAFELCVNRLGSRFANAK